MEYIILWNGDANKLAEEVNSYIAQGWEPHGGIAIDSGYSSRTFYQAMIGRQ